MAFNLDDIYYAPKASRYSAPMSTGDILPIVYGNLTDGSRGLWTLPCINTSTNVYCFAGHETLTVANGNSITLYEDGVTINPANYTFNAANNYESQGTISTITFSVAPAENAVITARGKGKPTAPSGATLMTNIIDIVYDFLVTQSGVLTQYDFDNTAKSKASTVFTDQGYVAAGIINIDESYWTHIYNMMGSFKGEAFIDTSDKLVLMIDDGSFQNAADEIIGKGDTEFLAARLMRDNLINRVPASYAYNYVDSDFDRHTDDSTYSNLASISTYGTRRPLDRYQFYFCRDKTSVNAVQSIITEAQGFPEKILEIEFLDMTLKRAHMEVGDYIVTSFDLLFGADGGTLRNEIFKILEINADYNKGNIKFRCLDTGKYLTVAYLLDGSKTLDGSWLLGGTKDTTQY